MEEHVCMHVCVHVCMQVCLANEMGGKVSLVAVMVEQCSEVGREGTWRGQRHFCL